MNIRVCCWNTDFWRHRSDYQHTWDYLCKEIRPDILMIQEAVPPENPGYLKYYLWKPIGGTRDWGSGIWSRYPLKEVDFDNGYNGHVIVGDVSLPNQNLTVISVHSPIESGYSIIPLHRILSDLTLILETQNARDQRNILLGGDLNASIQWDERQEGHSHRILFERIEDYGLFNCVKKINSEPVQTYRSKKGNFPWQIDHLFLSTPLETTFIDCTVLDTETTRKQSDHNPIILNLNMNFGVYEEMDLFTLEDDLGIFFKDKSLLVSALTSKTYRKEAAERGEKLELIDNECLAFLGDAVLELIVREHFFQTIDDVTGVLSIESDKVVDNNFLYKTAKRLKLNSFIRLGKGESKDSAGEAKIMSRTFESVLGAFYLDQGLSNSRKLILSDVITSTPFSVDRQKS